MEKAKILVVEDEGLVALDLTKRLKRFGYEVTANAASGEEALARAEETVPDLILMDIRIQGPLDGVAVAQAVRVRQDVAVVFLTAHSDTVTVRRALVTEPHGFLLKPFGDRELQIAIEVALNKHRMEGNDKRFLRTVQDCVGQVNKRVLQEPREFRKCMTQEKKLSGLLPMCANCKKIRNDKEEWEAVEAYIQAHSEAEFTHGICPDCSRELYSEYFSRSRKTAKASGGEP